MNMPAPALGLYFDDFTLDEEYVSPGRTITETDVIMFAGLSGDYNQLHTNIEVAKSSVFGQRLAHGALIFSMVTGLINRMGVIEGTAIALTSFSWKFSKPVFIGDTIWAHLKAIKKRAVGAEAGMVIAQITVVNQKDEVVESGELTVMVKRRPAQ
jgi:acyl dehydratase